jgi:hypothetical protein
MPTGASQIWPHLPTQAVEPQPVRRERNLLAESMYPRHRSNAERQTQPSTPRPQPSPAEVVHFWANLDPETARLWGFRKVGRR